MADPANHIFLPWLQSGAAANIPAQSTEQLSAAQAAVVSLAVTLTINSSAVQKTLRLYGPGDITGIDPQQVVRLEPRPGTSDFEPNYFPAIEFDRPDFPWLFTPLRPDTQARLRPWLCLIVVRKQDGVKVLPAGNQPLQMLDIRAPAKPGDELPDLSESHLWAHAQVTGADRTQLLTALESSPEKTVSRLICPRHLKPNTDYIACVVPAFAVGLKGGLGQPVDDDKLTPSWLSGSSAPVEIILPIYYSWEFRTSADGDFEELVRRLGPHELPPEAGKRPMDIGTPGFAVAPPAPPDQPVTVLGLEGALKVVNSKSDDWPQPSRTPFQNALTQILNLPWEIATRGSPNSDPVVGPPVYGCWQAAAHEVSPTPASPGQGAPPWLDELNLDPRNRAVAALGTQVVEEQQEQLMASAWGQLGDIEKINQRLRQAQLSREVNQKFRTGTFGRLSDAALLNIVGPAQSRVTIVQQLPNQPPTQSLLIQQLSGSVAPATVLSPLRKLARPRGAIGRQVSASLPPTVLHGIPVIGILVHPPPPAQAKGPVTIDGVSNEVAGGLRRNGGFFIMNPDPPAHWERIGAGLLQMLETFKLGNLGIMALGTRTPPPGPPDFFAAVKALHEYLTGLFVLFIVAKRNPINSADLKAPILASLDPARTVHQAVMDGAKIESPPVTTGDDLHPIMDAPSFPQPMYEALRDLSQDYLFPGLQYVPSNTVQLLQTNSPFIESFMVGLNVEMARELLWRNYPTDQRGTYFQQFWDTTGAKPRLDIPPIHQWPATDLGTIAAGGDKLVLLIRGDLLRRYPNTVIYAVKAVVHGGQRELATDHPDEAQPPIEAHPIFRGTLDPDVTFIGFDLTPEEVVTGDGWFFVLQEQPTEPRFGLDDDPFGPGESGVIPELKTWNDLNWAHLAPTPDQLAHLSYVSVAAVQLTPADPVKGKWGKNAAHMAYITKQAPVRVAIHATELIPQTN